MRLFHIELSTVSDYSWARRSPEYLEQYKTQIEQADKDIAERAELVERLGLGVDPMVINVTQLIELKLSGTEFKILRELRSGRDDPFTPGDFMGQFQVVADKLLALPINEGAIGHSAYNNRCEVHMPGQALATYNEMMLLSDTCTDGLQDEIDRGWRIIAACPQPDQRRPDYILGRYNPDREINTGAKRP